MDKSWLVRLYEDVGLPSEQAERAAEATRVRLLRRERPRGLDGRGRRSLTEFLVRDPLVSLNRIVGRGDAGLPFFDDETKSLSLIAFANTLQESGLDAVVAMAYAKVVVEAYEPKDLYGPVWQALGGAGPVDLEALRRMDWSPLRAGLPSIAGDTVVTRAETSAEVTVVTPAGPTTPATRPPAAPAGGASSGAVRRAPQAQPRLRAAPPPPTKPKK